MNDSDCVFVVDSYERFMDKKKPQRTDRAQKRLKLEVYFMHCCVFLIVVTVMHEK